METPNVVPPLPSGLAEAIQTLQDTAVHATEPTLLEVKCPDGKGGDIALPVVALPAGAGKVVVHSLLSALREGVEFARHQRLSYAAGPDHREGTARHQSLQSFIDHAKRFKAENSAVWADMARRELVSVLDYHPAGAASEARWGRHRGVYGCPLSEAWQAWGGGDEVVLDQDDFAALLDQRDRELYAGAFDSGKASPEPSTLISLASNLEVFSTATAKRERDPNTGRVKLAFSEDKGVAGSVIPPPAFLILVPIFQDSVPEPLEVRLRVTVEGGHARFHVQIHAAGDVLREAFNELCTRVATATELPLFVGTPE